MALLKVSVLISFFSIVNLYHVSPLFGFKTKTKISLVFVYLYIFSRLLPMTSRDPMSTRLLSTTATWKMPSVQRTRKTSRMAERKRMEMTMRRRRRRKRKRMLCRQTSCHWVSLRRWLENLWELEEVGVGIGNARRRDYLFRDGIHWSCGSGNKDVVRVEGEFRFPRIISGDKFGD